MSSFDSHSLTLQKIILVFKRLHAPLNSVIGKRGWKYNVLQAKLHFSDYSLKRANTPCHVFITSSLFPVITRYQALGRILLCFAWKDAAFVEYVRGAVCQGCSTPHFRIFMTGVKLLRSKVIQRLFWFMGKRFPRGDVLSLKGSQEMPIVRTAAAYHTQQQTLEKSPGIGHNYIGPNFMCLLSGCQNLVSIGVLVMLSWNLEM